MTSNLSLSNEASDFVMPDVMTLRKAAKNAQHAFTNLKTSYLPSIKEKCQRLDLYINKGFDQEFKTSIIALKTKLENQNLESMLATLNELITARSGGGVSEEDKAALIEEENNTKVQLKQMVVEVKGLFNTTASNFSDKLLNIQDVVIQSDTFQSGQEEKNKQKESFESSIQTLTEKKEPLNESRKELIEATKIMREKNIFQMFADTIPSEEDIDALDASAPEIAVVKQGINVFKKFVQGIGENFNYNRLVDARLELEKQIAAIDEQIEGQKKQLVQVNDELSDLSNMALVDTERNKYLEEVNKVLNSLIAFCRSLDNLIPLDMYSEIGKLFKEQLSYLNAIVRDYGRPL